MVSAVKGLFKACALKQRTYDQREDTEMCLPSTIQCKYAEIVFSPPSVPVGPSVSVTGLSSAAIPSVSVVTRVISASVASAVPVEMVKLWFPCVLQLFHLFDVSSQMAFCLRQN
jgi:hypothetical protein